MPTNDNDSATRSAMPSLPDPHGHAALMLVESLVHGLIEDQTLSTARAIEITERAVSVQGEVAEAADGAADPMWRSHALLEAIATSLRMDGDGDPLPSSPGLVT